MARMDTSIVCWMDNPTTVLFKKEIIALTPACQTLNTKKCSFLFWRGTPRSNLMLPSWQRKDQIIFDEASCIKLSIIYQLCHEHKSLSMAIHARLLKIYSSRCQKETSARVHVSNWITRLKCPLLTLFHMKSFSTEKFSRPMAPVSPICQYRALQNCLSNI